MTLTASFTPPTAAFPGRVTNDDPYFDNVQLLLHCDGTDGSTTLTDVIGQTVTATGNARLATAQSKFGGASAYCDGGGDYFSVSLGDRANFGTAPFTIECWCYIAGNSPQNPSTTRRANLINSISGAAGGFSCSIAGDATTTGTGLLWEDKSAGSASGSATYAISQGAWHHLAFSRSGTLVYMFVDGVLIGTSTIAIDRTLGSSAYPTRIGAMDVGSWEGYFNGYLDEIRITKGVARYTADFTAPTEAFPGTTLSDDPYFSSVKLLLHCDGADGSTTFTDLAEHTVVANGNVQIDTSQSKFGGASAYFDGTGDYLTLTTGSEFNIGTGDFTIEAWIRLASIGAWQAIFSKYVTWSSNADFQFEVSPEGLLYWSSGDSIPVFIVAAQPLAINTWYHVAACRRGGVTSLYVDGVLRASSPAAATIPNDKTTLYIGTYAVPGTYFNGWMDDIRITVGAARYVPIPPSTQMDVPTAFKIGYGHTWAEGDHSTVNPTTKVFERDDVERFPTYAYAGGNYHDLPRNGRIAGVLLEAGVPKADTWVFLSYRLTAQVVKGVRTDTAGNFEFTGLFPNEKYLVSAYESRTNPPGYNVISADYITPVPM